MIFLLIVGVVCLLVGKLVPTPPPSGNILMIIGAVCLVVAGVLIVLSLVGTHPTAVSMVQGVSYGSIK